MDQKQVIADRLKEANNILVTVSNNPSVDQLASCIGLTLALNKLGKHATAVFSGSVPNTIEFLQPEKTLEKNTDSLRDFIIALDKAKADKLRYKVEDKVVKIFITPYRTSINEKDLDFSQGDFNVDVVLALGVHAQTDLDQAITSHGRILHDATVATVNIKPGGELGTMNWLAAEASSLSELGVELIDAVDKSLMDSQMATAFLTGIVAETDRFSNEKTSPNTMSISAELMAAGANQQLVATKLEEPAPIQQKAPEEHQEGDKHDGEHHDEPPKPDDGTLEITHDKRDAEAAKESEPEPEEEEKPDEVPPMPQIHIDEHGSLKNIEEMKDPVPAPQPAPAPAPPASGLTTAPDQKGTIDPTQHMGSAHMILQPPTGGTEGLVPGVANDGSEQPSGAPQSFLPAANGSVPAANGPSPSYLPPASATTAAANSFIASSPSLAALPPSPVPQPAAPAPPPPPPPAPAFQPAPVAPAPPPQPAGFFQPLPPSHPTFAQPAAAPLPPPPPPAPLPPVPKPLPPPPPAPAPAPAVPPSAPGQTLSQLEQGVGSPHMQPAAPPPPTPAFATPPPSMPSPAPAPQSEPPVVPPPPADEPEEPLPDLESAREAVRQAIAGAPGGVEPIAALNAQPLGEPLHQSPPPPATPAPMPGGMSSFNPSVIQPTNAAPGNGMVPPGPPPMMPPQ